MLHRNILKSLKKTNKSIVLLGPRQTGKSTLIEHLQPDLTINLADEDTFLAFSRDPGELKAQLKRLSPKTVFIDEVQRLPSILNTIQTIVDAKTNAPRFYLTGSSARKLRRGQANLLPGRIIQFELAPCVYNELGETFDMEKALSYGTLPGIYLETSNFDREKILQTYAGIYLREEVQAEALTRNIEGFSRFLHVAAAKNGEFLDYTKLASDAGVQRKTAMRFFEILEETLLVHRVESFFGTAYKRLIKHPRYFFFDTGVLNALLGGFEVTQDRIGGLFETFVYLQLRNTLLSLGEDFRISNYRTSNGAEVDFILEWKKQIYAIEVKASKNVGPNDLSGLNSFADAFAKQHRRMIVFLGNQSKTLERETEALTFSDFMKMFAGS